MPFRRGVRGGDGVVGASTTCGTHAPACSWPPARTFSTTADTYAHTLPDQHRQAAETMDRILGRVTDA